MISLTMPIAGRISTYTSGSARNQKRCCHKRGFRPPPAAGGLRPTWSPPGVKKLQHAGRLERGERQQQEERRDELRPHEEWHPEPGEALRSELDDRDDEVH